MTHYERDKWTLYKSKLLTDKESIEMEDHLYVCDHCMDIFLSLIDSEELSNAENKLPTNFTEDIMEKIEGVIPITKSTPKIESSGKTKRKKKMIENIFMYYAAAASVILVLTAGGAFTKLTEFPIANITVDSERTNEGLGKVYSFSEKIASGTNSFINNLGNQSNKKINKKDNKIFNKKLIKKQGGK